MSDEKNKCQTCRKPLPDVSDFCPHCGAPQRARTSFVAKDPLVGTVLKEQYRIDAAIGQGGMGAVYRGFDLNLRRPVAIKVLPERFNSDKELVERFLREAQAAARLDHPNIIAIHTVATSGQTHFFVMKLINGRTLSSLVRGAPFDLAHALPVIDQVCDGLEAIHRVGFVHRDVKSSNIMVEPNGHATLLDFGILRATDEAAQLTQTGLVVGTPHYMAPEQARSSKLADHRSDIYALGVVMYEVFTGRLPFLAPSVFEIMTMHDSEPPVPPVERNPGLPKEMSDLVLRALAKRKEDRFQSMAELRDALVEAAAAAGFALLAKRTAKAPPRVFDGRDRRDAGPGGANAKSRCDVTRGDSFERTVGGATERRLGNHALGCIRRGRTENGRATTAHRVHLRCCRGRRRRRDRVVLRNGRSKGDA